MKKIEQKMFTPLLFAYVIRCNKNKSKFIQIKEFVSSRYLHYGVLHVICLPLLSFALIGVFFLLDQDFDGNNIHKVYAKLTM